MNKSPLSIVKERFKDKDGLIQAVKALATEDLWIDRVDSDKGLDCVSNRKLIKLHDTLSAVKKAFGGREKLIAEILKQDKRTKDDGYKARLAKFSTPRLWDHYSAGKRREKTAA
jgi:hypothetical protein